MKPEPTFESTLKACRDFNFGEDITREALWNTAYRLGRSRWHWGPAWAVTVRGWINTRIFRFKQFLCGVFGGHFCVTDKGQRYCLYCHKDSHVNPCIWWTPTKEAPSCEDHTRSRLGRKRR